MKAKAACAFLFFVSIHLMAQENPTQRHEMATNQLKRLAMEMSERCLSDVTTLENWKTRQPELRRQLLDMLGLHPLPKRTALKAQITGRLERDAYRIEKIVFQSMPGLYVTGNFYVPNGRAQARPTVLYLCGHSPHPLGAKFQYQDRAIWFAERGFPCLILDTHEFGELSGIHHGTHDLNMWHWLSLGYTPAGVEVWNAIRALDFLETRPEVNAKRIGLTGISGGGAMTWYTAAVDERIAAAAPVCSTFTWGSQADHWVARGQCDCIYYHNSYRWDFPIVAALIAPRPLMILSGQKDTIFPPDGYHAVFERGRRVYDLYAGGAGKSDRIREVDDNVAHSDPPLFLREARQWMTRWLKEDATTLPLETNSPAKVAAEDLACLTKIPRDATNFRIQDQFAPQASLKKPASRAAWGKRRAEVFSQLKDKVFGWFPTETIPFEPKSSRNTGGWHIRYGYADYQDYSLQSEPGVRIRVQVLTPKKKATAAPILIHLKRPMDSFNSSDADEILPVLDRYKVIIVNPRLSELSMAPADLTDVERTAVWVGRTIAAMQVWDTLRAVQWAVNEERNSVPSIAIYGKGDMATVALYAALFDDRINRVIVNDLSGSHWQGPALLNVLRVTDIPEVAGALAPRRLISLTKFPASFDHARNIYRLERAGDQFVQAASLPEALEIGGD
jgi:dienelactone hydrolase